MTREKIINEKPVSSSIDIIEVLKTNCKVTAEKLNNDLEKDGSCEYNMAETLSDYCMISWKQLNILWTSLDEYNNNNSNFDRCVYNSMANALDKIAAIRDCNYMRDPLRLTRLNDEFWCAAFTAGHLLSK